MKEESQEEIDNFFKRCEREEKQKNKKPGEVGIETKKSWSNTQKHGFTSKSAGRQRSY